MRWVRAGLGFLTAAATVAASQATPAPRAKIVADAPPFALSIDQLFSWTPDGPLADARNRSRVPLAKRFIDPDTTLDRRVRVLYAPDGMNGLGNYLTPQPVFNLYTFRHWAQIDLLNWFAGSADRGVNIPSRPWIDAAHRNGVKVIGTVFLAPVAFGGRAETVERLLRHDPEGRFPAADKLVAVARHYGFDGWLINQETDLLERKSAGAITRDPRQAARAAETARRMRDFTAYLTRMAPEPMEIHWYDSMLPDGTVRWQNALTQANLGFLERRGRVSDAMFLNYDWTPDGLMKGAALAERNGRSRYDVFIGADLWPARNAQPAFRNSDWIRALRPDPTKPALGSLALFAPHFNFNFPGNARSERFSRFDSDPTDVERFADAETRLFAGDDRNIAGTDEAPAWPGITWLTPARSTVMTLPFATDFNTGQGRHDFVDGKPRGGPWSDISRQDILPSWQLAYTPGARVAVRYDFDRAWSGGNSLRIEIAAHGSEVEVPLYLTDLQSGRKAQLAVTFAADRTAEFALKLHFHGGLSRSVVLRGDGRWTTQRWCIDKGRITRISLSADAGKVGGINLGRIALTDGCGD